MPHTVAVTVNGTSYSREIEPTLLLVEYLRETLGLTGTHVGCDTSQCGACTVLVDGRATKSCTMLAVQADGADVITVEGLAKNGELHPIQRAFAKEHGLQCVRCQHAPPRIRRIATAAAKREPGVVAVFTGKDLEATGMLPVFINVPSMNGSKHMPIATDKARYAGDAVAAVVADSRDAAK